MKKNFAAERNKSALAKGAALALLTQLLLTSTAMAQTTEFSGLPGSDWSDPANWTNGVPSGLMAAVVDRAGLQVTDNQSAYNLVVGEQAAGDLLITGTFASVYATIGGYPGGKGVVTLSGGGAEWTTNNGVVVGGGTEGQLIIEDGARLQGDGLFLAGPGGTGTVILRGRSDVEVNQLFVGGDGLETGISNDGARLAGKVLVSEGSEAIVAGPVVIGGNAGLAGELVVDGAQSLFDSDYRIEIGRHGVGRVVVSNGARLETEMVGIGTELGSVGALTVTGAGSTWYSGDNVTVGDEGTGSLRVEAGAQVDLGSYLILGDGQDASGHVVVTGRGSKLQVRNSALIFAGGVVIADGGEMTSDEMVVGASVTLTGAESRLTTGSNGINMNGGSLNIGAKAGEAAADGGTLVAGRLIVGASDAELVFNHTSANYVIDADIMGHGIIRQIAGVTRLSGDMTGFSGGTTRVTGGMLVTDSWLLGTTLVTGGTIGGSGGVQGTTTIGAGRTLAPGEGVGTMSGRGVVMFEAGSTLAVDIGANGASDLFDVDGQVIVTGGTVKVVSGQNLATSGTQYTVLKTTGGISGTFGVQNDLYFYDASLSQTSNALSLSFARNANTVAGVGETPDERSVGAAIEKLGSGHAVYDTVMSAGNGAVLPLLSSSAGMVHAMGANVAGATFQSMGSIASNRGDNRTSSDSAALGYAPTVSAPAVAAIGDATPVQVARSAAWLAPAVSGGRIKGEGLNGDTEWVSGGLTGGYEYRTSLDQADVLVGLALGYQRSSADSAFSTLSAGTGTISLYGGAKSGNLRASGALIYGASHSDIDRRIVLPGGDVTASADYWTQMGGLSSELAYELPVGEATTVAPLATLSASVSRRDSFTETGAGAFNLSSASQSWGQIDPGLGLELTHVIATETGVLTATARAEVQHALLDRPGQEMTFAGTNASFVVKGTETGRTRAVLGAGLDYSFGTMNLFADYQGSFSSGQHQHGARVGAKGAF